MAKPPAGVPMIPLAAVTGIGPEAATTTTGAGGGRAAAPALTAAAATAVSGPTNEHDRAWATFNTSSLDARRRAERANRRRFRRSAAIAAGTAPGGFSGQTDATGSGSGSGSGAGGAGDSGSDTSSIGSDSDAASTGSSGTGTSSGGDGSGSDGDTPHPRDGDSGDDSASDDAGPDAAALDDPIDPTNDPSTESPRHPLLHPPHTHSHAYRRSSHSRSRHSHSRHSYGAATDAGNASVWLPFKLKIFISFLQITASVCWGLDIPWPPLFRYILGVVSLRGSSTASANAPDTSHVWNTYSHKFMFLNLLPVMGFVLFALSRFVARVRRSSGLFCFRSLSTPASRAKSEPPLNSAPPPPPPLPASASGDGTSPNNSTRASPTPAGAGTGARALALSVFHPPAVPTRWDSYSWSWCLGYLLLLYPIVVSSLVRHFDCKAIAADATSAVVSSSYSVWVLAADPSVTCYATNVLTGATVFDMSGIPSTAAGAIITDNSHWLEIAFAWVPLFALITGLGVPIFFIAAVRLALSREQLMNPNGAGTAGSIFPTSMAPTPISATRALLLNRASVRHTIGLLVAGYAPKYYWFELIDLPHRVFMIAILPLAPRAYQLPVGMCVVSAYAVLLLLLHPYRTYYNHWPASTRPTGGSGIPDVVPSATGGGGGGDELDQLHLLIQAELFFLLFAGHVFLQLPTNAAAAAASAAQLPTVASITAAVTSGQGLGLSPEDKADLITSVVLLIVFILVLAAFCYSAVLSPWWNARTRRIARVTSGNGTDVPTPASGVASAVSGAVPPRRGHRTSLIQSNSYVPTQHPIQPQQIPSPLASSDPSTAGDHKH